MAIQQDDDSKQRDKFITEMAKKKKKKPQIKSLQ